MTSKKKRNSRGYPYACLKGYFWRVFKCNLTKSNTKTIASKILRVHLRVSRCTLTLSCGRGHGWESRPPSWAMIWGGAKRMGGGKRTRQRPPPENFWTPPKELLERWVLEFCTRKQSNDTWGGWKTYQTKGGPKPVLEGASVVRFSTPLFVPPPHAVLWSIAFLGERQSIAQKGVRAINAQNSGLENGSTAAKTSVHAPGLSADEREHPFVWYFGAGWVFLSRLF